jgi:hypothetical protein
MFRARPVVTSALGAAVVLSFLSVSCLLGLFTTPWFLCELFVVQIGLATRQPVQRSLSFVPAGAILLGAVLIASAVSAVAITLLGAGPGLTAQGLSPEGLDAVLRSGGLLALVSGVIALIVVVPLLYAPFVLIEQRLRFDIALVESVRLLVARGIFASVKLSLVAHAVQVSPLLVALTIAWLGESTQPALLALSATPLLCVSVPLGQGMIVWTYAQLREPWTSPVPAAELAELSGATRRCARAWTLLIVLPIASMLLLELSLVRPSRVPEGKAPSGELVAALAPDDHRARVLLPNTALEVSATSHSVSVAASDGGGVGDLPLTAAEAVSRVRIVRVRDAFALEIQQGGRSYVTFIDRAGVRLDDDLRARLFSRVSPLQLLLFLGTLLATGIASVPVLDALGRAQWRYRRPSEPLLAAAALANEGTLGVRRARNVAVLLLPLGLVCLAMAVRALLVP